MTTVEEALVEVMPDTVSRVAELFRAHKQQVYGLALRYGTGDPNFAEDVLQDVFVTVCRKLDTLETQCADDVARRGWFYRVTTNRCLSKLRRRAVRNAPGVRWLLGEVPEPASPELLAGQREDLEQVMAALGALPPKERVAFCMYYLDDLEQAEIGRVLGHGRSYVCKLIQRARDRLAHQCREAEDD